VAKSAYPPALNRLIGTLSRLPGIGPKTAARLSLFLLLSQRSLAGELARALDGAAREVRLCPVCFNLTDQEPCPICADPDRDAGLICVVEGPAEVTAVERTESFRGRYHVLGGLLSPLDKIGPAELRIDQLVERVKTGSIKEVVLATSPTSQGQTTAAYLADRLKETGVKVSRIALGLPLGSDLEYADPMSLKASLEGRREA